MKYPLGLLLLLAVLGCTPNTEVTGSKLVLETVEYPSGKETVKGVLCRPAMAKNSPAIILVHTHYGLTEWVKD